MFRSIERSLMEKTRMLSGIVISFTMCALFIPYDVIDNFVYWFGGFLGGMMGWDLIIEVFYEY